MPVITLPDGSKKEYADPVSVGAVAADIGAGLARAALAGRVEAGAVAAPPAGHDSSTQSDAIPLLPR